LDSLFRKIRLMGAPGRAFSRKAMAGDTVRPPDELGYFNAVRLPVARFTPGRRGRGAARAINVALGRLECLVLIRDRDGTQERSLLTAKELRPGRKPP